MALLALALLVTADAPPELGKVPWRRGFDEARSESARTQQPVLVLFDEVPGCSTVNAYGSEVLSDPFVVDASALFIPVFVSNNDATANLGEDARVLARYNEPTWNNPVVRIVDEHGALLAPRVTHGSGRAGLLQAMIAALEASKRAVPAWLRIVAYEPNEPTVTKTFACACFWEGEAALGAVDGVRTTEAGFVNGREVVRVRMDAAQAAAVDDVARALGYDVVDGAFRPAADDDKHRLRRTPWGQLANIMTPSQRTRINAALAQGQDPRALALLAPWQLRQLPRR